ncbi:MAG: hypothetical protein HC822_07435 [Oscillochloris sp.]|nr:hypothetical protein [Oscillochloris sp.]
MTQNLVRATVDRSNRNVLLLAVAGILGLLLAGALSYRYYYCFFAGPREMPRAELLGTADVAEVFHYYVSIAGDDVADTGFTYETTRNGRVVNSKNYLALLVDDRVLLIETPRMAIGTAFTGALIDVPGDIQREVVDVLVAEEPWLGEMLLPMMLRDNDFMVGGWFGLAGGAVVLGLSIFGLFLGLTRMSDPGRHQILRA